MNRSVYYPKLLYLVGAFALVGFLALGTGCNVLKPLFDGSDGGASGSGGGTVDPSSEQGPAEINTKSWGFDDPSDYTFDTNRIEVVGGVARLKSLDQTDDDNDDTLGFGAGTHNSTSWDEAEEAVVSSATSADFTSRVMDAGGDVSWSTINWDNAVEPVGKPLPNNGSSESGYAAGNVDMTSNGLLLHLDDCATITDDSPTGLSGFTNSGVTCTNATARFGMAADTSGGYIHVPNSTAINTGGPYTDRTIEVWIYADTLVGRNVIFEEGGTTRGLNIYTDGTDLYIGGWNDADGINWTGTFLSTPITTGQWYHVALRLENGDTSIVADRFDLLLNGVQVATGAASQVHAHSASNHLGGSPDSVVFHDGNSVGGSFDGYIDEFSLYNRALSDAELLDRYNRGKSRLRLQVRSCADATCSVETWIGPDGTASTYFTDSTNTGTSPLGEITLPAAVANNRYFQYRALFDSIGASITAELSNVVAGPPHFDAGKPSIEMATATRYRFFDATGSRFRETLGATADGAITYQLSPDGGTTWQYFDGSGWATASDASQSNSATEISANLEAFSNLNGAGDLKWKAFLDSTTGSQPSGGNQVEEDRIDLELYYR